MDESRCFNCKKQMSIHTRVGRRETCPYCGADLTTGETPIGIDVWLDTGVHIKGYRVFDAHARQEAKQKLIDMIRNDECDFEWEPLYDL